MVCHHLSVFLYIGTRDYYVSVALIITTADALLCREHFKSIHMNNACARAS